MPSICLLELVALLYVYRNHDFISDMNIATEENACSTRIGAQWQIIPFIVLVRFGTFTHTRRITPVSPAFTFFYFYSKTHTYLIILL